MQEIVFDDSIGWWIRPGKMDKRLFNSMHTYGQLPIRQGDTVLDLGGNIGSFANEAFSRGAINVISFEPEPNNFEVLEKNQFDTNANLDISWIAFQMAVIGPGSAKEIRLHINNGPNQGCHSIAPIDFRNGSSVLVKTVELEKIVNHYKPSVIKCDIEGAEYEVLLRPDFDEDGELIDFSPYKFPDFVKSIALEFHLHHRKAWREIYAPALMQALEEQGFTAIQPAVITNINWYTLSIWTR